MITTIYTGTYHSPTEGELKHWGIKGMKWGIRRYQNENGTLTPEGKKRYGSKVLLDFDRRTKKENIKDAAKMAVLGAGLGGAVSIADEIGRAKSLDAKAILGTAGVLGGVLGGTVGLAGGVARRNSVKYLRDKMDKNGKLKSRKYMIKNGKIIDKTMDELPTADNIYTYMVDQKYPYRKYAYR